jgi:hypothetical protein
VAQKLRLDATPLDGQRSLTNGQRSKYLGHCV